MAKTAKKKPARKTPTSKLNARRSTLKKSSTNKSEPKKKVVAKKTVAKKKVVAKKPVPKKKVTTKKPVPKKKVTAKKPVPKKKVTAKKPVTKKKVTAKKPMPKKKVVAKKPALKKNAVTKKTKRKKSLSSLKANLAQAVLNKTEKISNSKGVSRGKGLDLDKIDLPNGYKPTAEEEHMNPSQLLYFRNKLLAMREELIGESEQTILGLKSETRDIGDDAERASRETENILELRNRDRDRKMLAKVGAALRRIEEGTYGICEDTDEPIPVARLDARPQTTLTYDAQERREMLQRQYRSER